jgi:hypothetical protein
MNYKVSAGAQKQLNAQAASLGALLKKARKQEVDYGNTLKHEEKLKQSLEGYRGKFDPENMEQMDIILKTREMLRMIPDYLEECKPKLGEMSQQLRDATADFADALVRLGQSESEAIHSHVLGLLEPFALEETLKGPSEVSGTVNRLTINLQIPEDRTKLGVSFSEPEETVESLRKMMAEAEKVLKQWERVKADGYRFAPVPGWKERVRESASAA